MYNLITTWATPTHNKMGKWLAAPHTTAPPIIGGGGVKPIEGDDGGRAAAHGSNAEEG